MTNDKPEWIEGVILAVAELPDRNSPKDWPEAMLVTGDELRRIIEEHAQQEESDRTEPVVREYVEARNAFEEAQRPTSGFAQPPILRFNDPVVTRYREARAKLDALLTTPEEGS